ncbi:MAG: radical SAM protein [bacterium]
MRFSSAKRYLSNKIDLRLGTCLSGLDYVGLIITRTCNFKCPNCDSWKKQDIGELSQAEWLKVLEEVSGLRPYIEFTGGEPLIKKDLVFALASEGRRSGLTMCLNTNGSLIDEQVADDIISSGLRMVKVSLYSLNESIHNTLRGVRNAGARAKESLNILRNKNADKKIKIQIGFLLTGLNIDGINEIIDFASRNNFELAIQVLDFVIERQYEQDWEKKSEIWPTAEQLGKYLKPLVVKKPSCVINQKFHLKLIYDYYLERVAPKRICLAPLNNMLVWPNGDVSLCFRSGIIGNVAKEPTIKIWRGREARNERKRLRQCNKNCRIIGCNVAKGIKDLF